MCVYCFDAKTDVKAKRMSVASASVELFHTADLQGPMSVVTSKCQMALCDEIQYM